MNIFEIFGTIAINNANADKAITDTGNRANKLASSMGKSFDKIGKMAISCGKVIASGLSIGAAAMTAILKSSFDEYAEYEQLVGGVETLFKDSSSKVMDYAKQAYREQGLSANAYMSTVTSFSASLINGLHGDTAAAAEMANIAITDMADNANTFGTSIDLIQNAYQGFAKSNFTMLDNLKLGYGGTAEEMARLINDSGVLGDAMTVTAEDINNLSFDVFIAAIHEIQTEMGITGKTAEEASGTISGSFSALKSAWSNLLTGLASEEDITPLAEAFLETGNTLVTNITAPLPTMKQNFVDAFNYIAENCDSILSELGKSLTELFNIDTSSLFWMEILAGTAALLTGHYAVGLGLFYHAGEIEDIMWDEYYAKKDQQKEMQQVWDKLTEGILSGDPAAMEAYSAYMKNGDVDALKNYNGDLMPTTQTETLPDPMGIFDQNTTNNSTVFDPMRGLPGDSTSMNELQTTIQNWTNTFDMNAMATTIADAVAAAIGNITITTGNVTLNDGTLVGYFLPKINAGLGGMLARG